MANKDARFGLKPYRHLSGAPWNGATRKCYVSSLYATGLFIGDPVTLDTTLANKDATAKHQTVIKATAGDANPIFGVITGIEPNPADLSKNYIPASTGGYVYVAVANYDLTFIVQDDGGGTPAAVMVGQNAVLVYTHSGSTTSGLSGVEMSFTTAPAANASYQLWIVGLADIPDNELGDNAIWEVLVNLPVVGALNTAADGTPEGILGVTAS